MNVINDSRVNLGNCSVFYRSLITPESPETMILLHGKSFTSRDWLTIKAFERLSEIGFNVYAPDYPGFGESKDDGTFKFSGDFRNASKFIHDFGKKINVKRFVLLGPSMGGGIVLRTMLDYPDLISAAIVIGAAGVEYMRDELTGIDIPLLILWGEQDNVIPRERGTELRSLVRKSEFRIIPGANHAAYLDNPSVFYAEIFRFLKQR